MRAAPTRPAPGTVLVEVRGLLPSLRPAERRIGEALLSDPEGFATSSIAEIAELASTSTTTVVRFTRRVGYDRFKDLRHDLTEQNLRERMATDDATGHPTDISPDDRMHEIVAKIARNESMSIADTAQVIDIASLERAVAAIDGAQRVDLYGVGASAIVAVDLQRKLSRIGRIALEWPESHAAWTAAAVLGPAAVAIAISHSGATTDTVEYLRIARASGAVLGPAAVAIAISHSGATTDTVEYLRIARASGAVTIAITNHEQSPLAEAADVVLRTAARETPFRSGALGSRIAQLMVVDCLFTGVAQARYDESISALRRTRDAISQRAAR